MPLDIDFHDRSVLVVGGTSGINLGIADGFARAGARVGVASRSQDKVDAAVRLLSGHGNQAIGFTVDVREADTVQSVMENFHDAFGEIDVLVSGAAGNFPAPANALSPNGFKAVVDIDLLGTFHVLRSAYPYLVKPGASVINISAPQSYQPMELQVHVCAAKAGVDMVTRVLAMEWGPDGIRVNSIVPGPIADTEGMQRLAPTRSMRDAVAESVPLGREGTKEDIAQMALFLSSSDASYITGTVIPVDGGWSLAGVSSLSAMMKKQIQAATD